MAAKKQAGKKQTARKRSPSRAVPVIMIMTGEAKPPKSTRRKSTKRK